MPFECWSMIGETEEGETRARTRTERTNVLRKMTVYYFRHSFRFLVRIAFAEYAVRVPRTLVDNRGLQARHCV